MMMSNGSNMETRKNNLILLVGADEDTDVDTGYFCELSPDGCVLCSFWAPNQKTMGVKFDGISNFYEHAQEYLKSELVNYTPLHKSKTKMCDDYIKSYDKILEHVKNQNGKYIIR